jgi:hypothetical protein
VNVAHDALPGMSVRLVLLACCVVGASATALMQSVGASPTAPTINLSPDSNLHSGESISISVGPNSTFAPHARVNILECADPGGSPANLPKDDSTCDGNTIQGDSILVAANGSFSEANYSVYALPSTVLGEQANGQPVCNQSHACVLFIGQNQNDFTAPKVFSQALTIAPAVGSPGSTTTVTSARGLSVPASSTPVTGASASSDQLAAGSVDPSVSLGVTPTDTSGVLANTGAPAKVAWVVALGSALLFFGSLGRRYVGRARS